MIHLDIVDEQSLNWGAIDQAIVQAKQVTDLDVLDSLVPLSGMFKLASGSSSSSKSSLCSDLWWAGYW
ncbi:hypothetical protein OK016_13290 [Vibrio chagasii]|nr:hypothetical protein [Vibrio chagasii]